MPSPDNNKALHCICSVFFSALGSFVGYWGGGGANEGHAFMMHSWAGQILERKEEA